MINLHTDLPPSFEGEDVIILRFNVKKNMGIEYVLNNFKEIPILYKNLDK